MFGGRGGDKKEQMVNEGGRGKWSKWEVIIIIRLCVIKAAWVLKRVKSTGGGGGGAWWRGEGVRGERTWRSTTTTIIITRGLKYKSCGCAHAVWLGHQRWKYGFGFGSGSGSGSGSGCGCGCGFHDGVRCRYIEREVRTAVRAGWRMLYGSSPKRMCVIFSGGKWEQMEK